MAQKPEDFEEFERRVKATYTTMYVLSGGDGVENRDRWLKLLGVNPDDPFWPMMMSIIAENNGVDSQTTGVIRALSEAMCVGASLALTKGKVN